MRPNGKGTIIQLPAKTRDRSSRLFWYRNEASGKGTFFASGSNQVKPCRTVKWYQLIGVIYAYKI